MVSGHLLLSLTRSHSSKLSSEENYFLSIELYANPFAYLITFVMCDMDSSEYNSSNLHRVFVDYLLCSAPCIYCTWSWKNSWGCCTWGRPNPVTHQYFCYGDHFVQQSGFYEFGSCVRFITLLISFRKRSNYSFSAHCDYNKSENIITEFLRESEDVSHSHSLRLCFIVLSILAAFTVLAFLLLFHSSRLSTFSTFFSPSLPISYFLAEMGYLKRF